MGTLHRLMFKAAYAEDRPPLAPRPALARGPVERPAASDVLVGGGTLYRLLRSRAAMMELEAARVSMREQLLVARAESEEQKAQLAGLLRSGGLYGYGH